MLFESGLDPMYHHFVGFSLPNAIAPHDNELHSLTTALEDVGSRSDHLFWSLETLVLLELKVSQGAGNVQSLIDSAICDKPSCLLDPSMFSKVFRLMIEAEGHCFALTASHTPRISSIGHVNFPVSDKTDIGSAPGILLPQKIVSIVNAYILPDEGIQLFPARFGLHDEVHFIESLYEGSDIVFAFEGRIKIEFDGKMFLDVLCHLRT